MLFEKLFKSLNKKSDPAPVQVDEQAEKKRQIAEWRKREAAAEAAFSESLEKIPSAEIRIAEAPAKHNALKDGPEYSFSNITKKTNREKLGDFTAIDVETTGLTPSRGEIVEISAVRFRAWQPVEKFTTLCRPKKGIDPEAAKVNGITEELVAGCPAFDEIVEDLAAFLGQDALVGHNLEFDLRFLWKYGLDPFSGKRKLYDTLDIAERTLKRIKRKYDKEWEMWTEDYDSDYDVFDYKLGTLCQHYGIPFYGAHRSLADAYVTGQLFHRLSDDRL